MAAAEAAAEAADAAAVPAAAGKASKCPEEQQTKSLNPLSNLALLCHNHVSLMLSPINVVSANVQNVRKHRKKHRKTSKF